MAAATLSYARTNHAPAGRLTEVAGALALATTQTAHAVLAERGEWVTNEKKLVERAGLRGIDRLLTRLDPEPRSLVTVLTEAKEALAG
jgi:hypothetical protein